MTHLVNFSAKQSAQPRVVLVSDNTAFGLVGVSRYMGPYVLASRLEAAGFEVAVIDYVTRVKNPIEYIASFITPETVALGVSSTFMNPYDSEQESESLSKSTDSGRNYFKKPIIFNDPQALEAWLDKLKVAVKSRAPNIKIFLGGAKASFVFEYDQNLFRQFDYIMWGHSDGAFVQVLKDLENGIEPAHQLLHERKVIDTYKTYVNAKVCPETEWQSKWAIQPGEALPIEISRGCIFNCKFCHYDKRSSTRKELNALKHELIRNYEIFGTRYYHFCDDCFNDNREKVENICRTLIELPFEIEWTSYVRVDTCVKFPHLAPLMVKSGARGLFWGLESFSFLAARRAGKGTPPEQVKKFLKEFYMDFGEICTSQGSFIVGLPGETKESQLETMNWVVNEPALHFVNVGPLRINAYKEIFDKQTIDYSDYSKYPEKFGFTKFDPETSYWEHATMNSLDALELSNAFNQKWREVRGRGLINSMWNYSHLRSLGYNQGEIWEIYFKPELAKQYFKDTKDRFQKRLTNYHSELLKNFT